MSAPARTGRVASALGAAFLAVIVPYGVLAVFASPSADDLTYALDTRRDGYWTAYRDQYFMWNGRYGSNLFELGGPMVWQSLLGYRLVAFAMIAGTVAAMYSFVRLLAGTEATRAHAVIMALGLTALFLSGVPALGETIYWYTGSVTYQLSSLFLVLQVVLVIGALKDRVAHSGVRSVAAAALLVLVVGMNEVAMLLAVTFYAAVLIVSLIERRRAGVRTASVMLAVAVASGLAVWLAPGNAVRSAMFPVRHEVVRSIALTAAQTVRFLAEWITSGSLLLASLIYLPIGTEIARRGPWQSIGRAGVVALVAGTLLVVPLSVFPAYWATGVLGQHRTVSVAYFAFLLMWFTTLTALLAVRWLPAADGWLMNRRVRIVAGALLVVSLAFTQNGYGVATDLAYGRPMAFAREITARSSALARCATSPSVPCAIEPIANKPVSFYVLDVSPEPGDWVSAAYAGYFGVSQVIVKSLQ